MCLIDVRPKKQTKIMGDRTMKKTFIPMAILVATLLTGCQASDTIANVNNIANDIVNETTASVVVEETNTDIICNKNGEIYIVIYVIISFYTGILRPFGVQNY